MPTLQELQAAEREQGLVQLRTLYTQNLQSLVRLPRLAAEFQAMLATTDAVDYAVLADQMQAALRQASDFLLAVDLAPIDYPGQPELVTLGQNLCPLVNSGSMAALSARFQQARDGAAQAAKDAQADRTRQAETKARQQAEEAKRQAETKARQQQEEEAKRQAAQAVAQRRATAKALGFVDNGDGTVTDTHTGLMWKQCAEGQSGPDCKGSAGEFNWDVAMQIPKTLNQRGGFAGCHDWRLPTKDELASLVMHGRSNPVICTEAFPNAPSNVFWSSSPGGDSSAWRVYFGNGHVYGSSRSVAWAVRLVRASQ